MLPINPIGTLAMFTKSTEMLSPRYIQALQRQRRLSISWE